MGRKGWTHLGMPSAYVQIIRGPRPKVGAVAQGALPVQVCWWREGQGQPGRDQRQSTASSPFARSDPAKFRSNQFRIALPRRNREQGLVEGKDRLTALQREANATPQSPPPTVPTDFAHELARLRASVQLWKAREGRVEVRIAGAGHPVTRFGDDTTRQSVGTATQCFKSDGDSDQQRRRQYDAVRRHESASNCPLWVAGSPSERGQPRPTAVVSGNSPL